MLYGLNTKSNVKEPIKKLVSDEPAASKVMVVKQPEWESGYLFGTAGGNRSWTGMGNRSQGWRRRDEAPDEPTEASNPEKDSYSRTGGINR
jgi:hypothetical protein